MNHQFKIQLVILQILLLQPMQEEIARNVALHNYASPLFKYKQSMILKNKLWAEY